MRFLEIGVLVFMLCTLTAASSESQPQRPTASQTQATQNADAPADKTAAQRRYDPLAGREHLRGGIWENALDKINPENKNYGESLSGWRQIVVSETIHSFVFWTSIALCLGLLLALLYIYWLLRERARRLQVTVNILTQISNAYIDARDHALDAIEKHNQLADDYNAMAEKMAALEQQKSSNQKRVRTESISAAETDGMSDEAQMESADAKPTAAHPGLDPQLLAQLRQEAEAQARQKLAHQISALNEKNKSLRISMNEVISQNETLKREQAAFKGE